MSNSAMEMLVADVGGRVIFTYITSNRSKNTLNSLTNPITESHFVEIATLCLEAEKKASIFRRL